MKPANDSLQCESAESAPAQGMFNDPVIISQARKFFLTY